MSKIAERLPVSVPNAAVVGALLVGAALAGLRGNGVGAVILVAMAIGWAGIALYARSSRADDRSRVGNFDPRDERDRTIGRNGFALVGAAALILTGGEMLVRVVLGDNDGATLVRFMVLAAAWSIGVSNSAEKI
ncbi:hypothetical protein [Cryobacterium sp. PAMC25264]|uniref:hypothetical protein n=1 Tax=Cryobacterium sp. PAMC25264 TaxID=2861288 RepID=UPI001C62C6BB|nr:hypothetical protein [Cryobacterium sp. PAMC25264]QYF72105.1 hypothetical protein KY500_09410 [Cryobacterium sp. PAMC25264]